MRHIALAMLNRPVAVMAWTVALLVAGSWAATNVPLEWVPQVELPVVRVSASWPGASPRAVEQYVTAPIERAGQAVEGTAGVESLSREGQTTVTLEVSEEVSLGAYVARLNEQLALVQRDLPNRVTPRLTKQIPEELRDEQGFMTLQLIGPQAPGTLRRWAEDQIAPQLSGLPGVADVVVEGGTEREVLVTLDPDRLAAYGLEAGAMRGHLADALTDRVYGRLRSGGEAALLLSPAPETVEALRSVVVRDAQVNDTVARPVRIGDIATVERGPAPRRSISRIDGQPVVTLTIDRAPASHMLEVAERVNAQLEALAPILPEEARLIVADDRSESVRAELRDLQWRGGLGLVLVALVLLMMLRSVRAVGIVLVSVAVALAVGLALMGPLGLTLNLLTLAGLVLVFGILVDNSVVMVEQLMLQRDRLAVRGWSGPALEQEATRHALRAVWLPLLGGTTTTMAVMAPLVYLSGELRTLFLPFGLLTALTLAASLATAALIVPVMGRWLPPPEPAWRLPEWMRAPLRWPFWAAARFPKTTALLLLLLLGTPLWLLPDRMEGSDDETSPQARWATVYNATLGSDAVRDAREWLDPALGGVLRPFFETTDFGDQWDFDTQPSVRVRLGFPPGNPIHRADSLMQRFEQVALASESVERTIARISERSAYMQVQFYEPALDTPEPYIVREELIQEAVLLAGIRVSVGGLLPQGYYSGVGGMASGYTIEAHGSNYDDLEALAERFAERLRAGSRRVASVNTNAGRFGRQTPREVLTLDWPAAATARTGLRAQHIAGELRPVLSTRFPALFADLTGETQVPLRIVVEGAESIDIDTFVDRPLPVTDSIQVKLKSVSDYVVEEVPSSIERENQQYKRYIRVDYRGPNRMGSEYINGVLEGFQTPAGYRLERSRSFFFTEETRQAFGWVIAATVLLILLVTAVVFESWRLPVLVLVSLPLAAIGLAVGFWWADIAFAEGAFIGVVLLVGIAANDAILLVDRYRQLRTARPHGRAAVLARLAVRERLRPMWTTTISTCVAMLPLLVFPAENDFWMGLAVAVTGGLLAATLLAPVAVVALLAWPERRGHPHPQHKSRN
ncbi:acriflavin resistance protein [Longimonas halophila]|uniref:Acriflavin resistance protein n=1 Tax=Longimonas halophila TaxID=1469170 RepID=A0A2H3P4Y9_9BACT|nr:efflux RND transporter permease subunit [Longimonas halophila]PEN09569.1 acriflavin resistance protein [Longimonas halophila]